MLRSLPSGKGGWFSARSSLLRRLWMSEGPFPFWTASISFHPEGEMQQIWGGGCFFERGHSSEAGTMSSRSKPKQKPHVVDLLKKAGVDLSDCEGFDGLFGKGPNAKLLVDSLEPKVDLLRRFGVTEATAVEGVLRRFDSKWMLQPQNTTTMRKNLKYLEDQLHFPRVGIKRLVESNPSVLTERMTVRGGECIVSMLAKHFHITLVQFQHLAIFHPEILTYEPARVQQLRFWMKKAGVGPEEKCRVVRKEPSLIGMDLKEGCELDKNLAELRKILDKDVDMNGNQEKVRKQRTAKVFAAAPRVVMQAEILPKFIQTMKEHNINEAICAKVVGRCTYVVAQVDQHMEVARRLNFLLKVMRRHIRDVVRHGGVLGQSMEDLIFPRFGYLKELGLNQANYEVSDIVMSSDAQYARLHESIKVESFQDFKKDFVPPAYWSKPRV
ncbi:hypothetical protein BSKO_12092 [Bryopsis sp. KO-2023]|nr:hypothetical protein BSKO_12092 [Bryopsis sp. KO-2023]